MASINLSTLPQKRLKGKKDKRRLCYVVPVAHVPFLCVYEVPEEMDCSCGTWVIVPLRKKEVVGVIWGGDPHGSLNDLSTIRPIIRKILRVLPLKSLPASMMRFMEKVARYNVVSLGRVLQMTVGGVSLQKPISPPKKIKERISSAFSMPSYTLLSQQTKAVDAMKKIASPFLPFVLEGVTGSGKTAVYMHFMAHLLRKGGQGLILMPEIALSQDTAEKITTLFPLACEVVLWHSELAPKMRRTLWHRLLEGENLCVIGTRSALFLPMTNLKGIVLDEEHDEHFKQEHHVLYNGRDMGVLRGQQENIPVILSSATPSLETLHNVQQERYGSCVLQNRFSGIMLPQVKIVDMRREKMPSDRWLSHESIKMLEDAYAQCEQSLVFLNRRGYAPMMLCKKCGHRYGCPSCDVFLVRHGSILLCHHCGGRHKIPQICSSCHCEESLVSVGPGVERIAQEIHTLFPKMRVEVLSSDIPREEQRTIIRHIQNRTVDVVVGTQVIAKGYHFPFLTKVLVVDGDMGLKNPDLRATEKTWQILQQVGGRAGRESKRGTVLIQTYAPDHALMKSLANDPTTFPQMEMEERKRGSWPPFGSLIGMIISSTQERPLQAFVQTMEKHAPTEHAFKGKGPVRLLGPIEAPLYRLRNRYRMRFLIKGKKRGETHTFLHRWLSRLKVPSSIRLVVDVDPRSFL